MRFLIITTDYGAFLRELYRDAPDLAGASYADQVKARSDSLFGVADFYSANLRALGHEACEVFANNWYMQRAWAREHQLRLSLSGRVLEQLPAVVGTRLGAGWPGCLQEILAAQVRHYRPDVLLNQALDFVGSSFIRESRRYARLVVGQIASPLPRDDLGSYDLLLSSLPNFVERFRRAGLRAHYHRLGFEPRVLDRLQMRAPRVPVSFVGSISPAHAARNELLGRVAEKVELQFWGQMSRQAARQSIFRSRHRGPAWGTAMYQLLRDSRITLNAHIGIAEGYANNMRLYEATGVGTLLLTDWKKNLADLFEPDKEVATFRTERECLDRIRYYLAHEDERAAVARAGQERTLREHTYRQRIEELIQIVEGEA